MSDLKERADALANDLCVNHGLDAHDAIRDAIFQGMVEALDAEHGSSPSEADKGEEMSKESDAKDKEFRRDSYWNKERLEAHAAPRLEFNPEKKPWVGLTEEEATALWESTDDRDSWELIKQVEKTLKEKNT